MKVLVALDQTEASSYALEWILAHKWQDDCQFKIVTVMPPLHDLQSAGMEILQTDPRSRERRELKTSLENFLLGCTARMAESFARENIEIALAEGDAARAIVTAAVTWGAELVVVGRRELGFVSRMMTWSVSREVERLSTCAVKVVTADDIRLVQARQALQSGYLREKESKRSEVKSS